MDKPAAALSMNRLEAVLLLRVMIDWYDMHCRSPHSPFTTDNCASMKQMIDRLWIPVLLDEGK